jgi:hypothetical protein
MVGLERLQLAPMNVFVLTTGRSGSLAFAEACRHIRNYSAGHETRVGLLGSDRLAYPPDHIEVDNRLAWFPGRLEAAYGDDAFYVHLRRDAGATAASMVRRWSKPAMRSYRQGILWDVDPETDRVALAADLVATLDSNIRHYLRDKSKCMTIDIETAASSFPSFWERIGAEGDLQAALAEFDARHHEGVSRRRTPRPSTGGGRRGVSRVRGWRSWKWPRLRGSS